MNEPLRLTKDRDFKQHLAWSPDGKKIAIYVFELWVIDTGGSVRKLGAVPPGDLAWRPVP